MTATQRGDAAFLTGLRPGAFGTLIRSLPNRAIDKAMDPWQGSVFSWEIAGRLYHFPAYQMLDSQLFAGIVGTPAPRARYWSDLAEELMRDSMVLT